MKNVKRIVRVGSRDSKLAVAQTKLAIREIEKLHPELQFEIVTMKTTGDLILDQSLDKIGGKGLFVKELDQALLDEKIDFSIHSLKDLPMETPEELPLIGFSKRGDPRDVMIVKQGMTSDFETGCIGTSSRRRMEQLKKLYPHATFRGIRGNVQTRLRKLEEEDYVATILAYAGISRLGMEDCIARVFSIEEVVPAAGQGILVFQGRKGEDYSYLQPALDKESEYVARAERSFVGALDGGCSAPTAAYACIKGNELKLRGLYFHEEAGEYSVGEKYGEVTDAEKIGNELAVELKRLWE